MGQASAKADLEEYQKGYPTTDGLDNKRKTKNLRFYKNEIKSTSTGKKFRLRNTNATLERTLERASGTPSGDYIDNIHKDWWGEYDLLEDHHGYIQWLFPIHEQGLNFSAQKLMRHEAKAIRENDQLRARIIKSYELMLDFYGMVLEDKKTGKISRSKNFRPRYDNLNNCFHNYLRITRILKCLGEVGLEHYKLPFLLHVGTEILVHNELTNAKDSLIRYWAPTLRKEEERDEMEKRIDEAVKKQREEEERRRKEMEERIELSQLLLRNDPKGLFDKKISVKWYVKSRYYPYERTSKFYGGVIKEFNENTNKHLVVYDDGDKREYKNMAKKKEFYFEDDSIIDKAREMKKSMPEKEEDKMDEEE